MNARSLFTSAGIAGALALGAAAPVLAQVPPGCTALCAVSCIKPISIPDRWDDVSPIAGYTGGGKRPNWQNNGMYDQESFNDLNGNRVWDPAEPYTDLNNNSTYDAEAYSSTLTGYVAEPVAGNFLSPAGDLGLELTLHPGVPGDTPTPAQYFSIGLPPVNRGTPDVSGDAFRENMAACNPALVGPGDICQTTPGSLVGAANQSMRDLIASDPNAYWDPLVRNIAGSAFGPGGSPRIVLVVVHDPRLPIWSGASTTVATKVIGFFMDEMVGSGLVRGHVMRTSGLGQACAGGGTETSFVVACVTPATPMTWGRVKGIYR